MLLILVWLLLNRKFQLNLENSDGATIDEVLRSKCFKKSLSKLSEWTISTANSKGVHFSAKNGQVLQQHLKNSNIVINMF